MKKITLRQLMEKLDALSNENPDLLDAPVVLSLLSDECAYIADVISTRSRGEDERFAFAQAGMMLDNKDCVIIEGDDFD